MEASLRLQVVAYTLSHAEMLMNERREAELSGKAFGKYYQYLNAEIKNALWAANRLLTNQWR